MTESVTGEGRGLSRRAFLKKGGIIGAGIAGAVVEAKVGFVRSAVDKLLNRPTQDQIDAKISLDDSKTAKYNFIVRNDPDVIENGGLNVRQDPWIPYDPKSEPPNTMGRLKAGEGIVGIPWQGINTNSSTRRKDLSWVAFKHNSGRVGFVDRKYLEQQSQKP